VRTENKKALKAIAGKRSQTLKKFVNNVAKQTAELDAEMEIFMEN
jgi:hypothetical protein